MVAMNMLSKRKPVANKVGKSSRAAQVSRATLDHYLADVLEIQRFADYCPNGLQVEGRDTICKVVTGVTASLALLEAAVAAKADAVLVHHGLFWKGDDMRITGWKKARIETLLANGINLFAYHLPLDAHPALGNNAQLGKRFGVVANAHFGDKGLGCIGSLKRPTSSAALEALLEVSLARKPLVVGVSELNTKKIERIAWCTGGAQGYFEDAIAAGADAYISGEISEQTTHLARESGVPYFACGHHATERYGAQAVGAHLAKKFGLNVTFIDIDNPV
jgi:dinuclear metal center YbgI/SA1388 family protein